MNYITTFLEGISSPVILLIAIVLLYTPLSAQSNDLALADISQDDTLFVRSMILTTNVENWEPVDTVKGFDAAEPQAYCHLRVFNKGSEKMVTFCWCWNGENYFRYGSKIGISPGWRTWSMITPRKGDWTIQILNGRDEVLASREFVVME